MCVAQRTGSGGGVDCRGRPTSCVVSPRVGSNPTGVDCAALSARNRLSLALSSSSFPAAVSCVFVCAPCVVYLCLLRPPMPRPPRTRTQACALLDVGSCAARSNMTVMKSKTKARLCGCLVQWHDSRPGRDRSRVQFQEQPLLSRVDDRVW